MNSKLGTTKNHHFTPTNARQSYSSTSLICYVTKTVMCEITQFHPNT